MVSREQAQADRSTQPDFLPNDWYGYRGQVNLSEEELEAIAFADEAELVAKLRAAGRPEAERLAQALAEQYALPYADLAGQRAAAELFALLPAAQAFRLGVFPLRAGEGWLEIALADPGALELPERLRRAVPERRLRFAVASPAAIEAALKRSQGTGELLKDASGAMRLAVLRETAQGGEEAVSLESLDRANDAASPVVRFVNTLLVDALERRASDIHLEIHDRGIALRYRIDGVLYPASETLDRRHHAALVSRLKVMAELVQLQPA